MARIRTVKPEFWQHPKVTRVSRDARLFFLGLLNEADDVGRLRYSPKRLAGVLFPEDDDVRASKIERWTGELENERLVARYEVDGAELLVVCGFTEHQHINRPSPSRLPAPPASPHEPLTEDSVSPHGDLPGGKEQGTGNKEQGTSDDKRPREKPPQQGAIFISLIAGLGLDARSLTKSDRSDIGKTARELADIGVEPEQMLGFPAWWSKTYPGAAISHRCYRQHWSKYVAVGSRGEPTAGDYATGRY